MKRFLPTLRLFRSFARSFEISKGSHIILATGRFGILILTLIVDFEFEKLKPPNFKTIMNLANAHRSAQSARLLHGTDGSGGCSGNQNLILIELVRVFISVLTTGAILLAGTKMFSTNPHQGCYSAWGFQQILSTASSYPLPSSVCPKWRQPCVLIKLVRSNVVIAQSCAIIDCHQWSCRARDAIESHAVIARSYYPSDCDIQQSTRCSPSTTHERNALVITLIRCSLRALERDACA